jgi:RNA polymerase sigma-70 factor (ECF subfamily)
MTQCIATERPHPAETPSLTEAIQIHLGRELRALYGNPDEDKLPRSLGQLLTRVAQVTRDMHQAEDLVQETVLKAIGKQETFEAGTNLQAWLFTILRNLFFSARRTKQREVEDADGAHAASMITIPDQEDRLTVQDVHAALSRLPREQREALLLVSAEGLSYEEAAEVLATKVGTIKSRVNRARTRLAELMGLVQEDGIAGVHGAPA